MEPVKSSTGNVEIVYGESIKELDESVHFNSVDLVRKLNEIIRKVNKK